MAKITTKTTYKNLLKELKTLIDDGQLRAGTAAGQVLVETYWQLGKRIASAMENAERGEAMLMSLAQDLVIPSSTLYQSVAFARNFDSPKNYPKLSWSHYRALLRVHDGQARTWYADLASEKKLTVARLAEAIQSNRHGDLESKPKTKTRKAHHILKKPSDPRYVYRATLDRVVDGDTLIVTLDLGFGVHKNERIRLAGVDTPAAKTPEGQKATDFVRTALGADDASNPSKPLCILTKRTDRYGRYIGHVFYPSDSMKGSTDFAQILQNGEHLNQQLLDEDLATAV